VLITKGVEKVKPPSSYGIRYLPYPNSVSFGKCSFFGDSTQYPVNTFQNLISNLRVWFQLFKFSLEIFVMYDAAETISHIRQATIWLSPPVREHSESGLWKSAPVLFRGYVERLTTQSYTE